MVGKSTLSSYDYSMKSLGQSYVKSLPNCRVASLALNNRDQCTVWTYRVFKKLNNFS